MAGAGGVVESTLPPRELLGFPPGQHQPVPGPKAIPGPGRTVWVGAHTLVVHAATNNKQTELHFRQNLTNSEISLLLDISDLEQAGRPLPLPSPHLPFSFPSVSCLAAQACDRGGHGRGQLLVLQVGKQRPGETVSPRRALQPGSRPRWGEVDWGPRAVAYP